ncbi:MAG: hypothetical protein ACRC62_29260 [Microcoleus sp.]
MRTSVRSDAIKLSLRYKAFRSRIIDRTSSQLSTIDDRQSRAGTLALQLSTIDDRERGRSHYNSQRRGRARGHRPYQISIDRERGRSHYNSQLLTLNSQLFN